MTTLKPSVVISDHMSIGERIKKIRNSEGLGRAAFCEKTGIAKDTLVRIEQGKNEPRSSILTTLAGIWPEYSYWLLTGKTYAKNGQISPEIEEMRKELPRERRGTK